MATNPFKHVRSGEPLVIHASAYNAMLDAGQAVRNRRLNIAKQGSGFDSLFVHIVNLTGKHLERFSVVGLDGPLVTDFSESEDAFCERIVMNGVVPTPEHKGKFAVLQEDAEPDQCVRACLYGVTIAKVRCDSESQSSSQKIRFCDIKENDTQCLASGGGGAEVLWHDKQSNWAIIRIGNVSQEPTLHVGVVISPINAGLDSENEIHVPSPECSKPTNPFPKAAVSSGSPSAAFIVSSMRSVNNDPTTFRTLESAPSKLRMKKWPIASHHSACPCSSARERLSNILETE